MVKVKKFHRNFSPLKSNSKDEKILRQNFKVVMHNSISLDGSIKRFEVNIGLHYKIVADYKPEVIIVGSITAKTGITEFMKSVPIEEKKDFVKPQIKKGDKRALWAIPDSKGILKGFLHVYRNSEYCQDVIIFLTESTPKDYISYLKERKYDYYVLGKEKVDLKKAVEMIKEKYGAKTVMTDTGGVLNCAMLEQKLIDEISIIIHPEIVGGEKMNLFRTLDSKNIKLRLKKADKLDKDYAHLVYSVIYNSGEFL
jgi:2,5-diamino-6-(ribosylamino)-4(3H)-pyrimidinone 5'-phosphate reductase